MPTDIRARHGGRTQWSMTSSHSETTSRRNENADFAPTKRSARKAFSRPLYTVIGLPKKRFIRTTMRSRAIFKASP